MISCCLLRSIWFFWRKKNSNILVLILWCWRLKKKWPRFFTFKMLIVHHLNSIFQINFFFLFVAEYLSIQCWIGFNISFYREGFIILSFYYWKIYDIIISKLNSNIFQNNINIWNEEFRILDFPKQLIWIWMIGFQMKDLKWWIWNQFILSKHYLKEIYNTWMSK